MGLSFVPHAYYRFQLQVPSLSFSIWYNVLKFYVTCYEMWHVEHFSGFGTGICSVCRACISEVHEHYSDTTISEGRGWFFCCTLLYSEWAVLFEGLVNLIVVVLASDCLIDHWHGIKHLRLRIEISQKIQTAGI